MRVVSVAITLAAMLLAGCQSSDREPRSDSILGDDLYGDLLPQNYNNRASRYSSSTSGLPSRAGGRQLTQNFGPDAKGLSPVGSTDTASAGEYSLNFENADVKDVIRAVLNDALHVNYTISGDVSGPVTISSARPVSREALLSTLESVLSSVGYSLIKSGDGYRVASTGTGGGVVDNGQRTQAGFGVSVIPLKFVQAPNMMELLSGFVAQTDGLRVSASGNSIIARGSGPQRSEVVDAVVSFDSDFMQQQSVSIYRLVQARPEDVVPELERIFNAKGENSLIQFRPMSRVRGVLAISKNPTLLKRAETWIRRLDQQDADTGQNVVVYKAKYRKAAELAQVMKNLFGGSTSSTPRVPSGQSPLQQDPDPTAPQDTVTSQGNLVNSRVASAFGDLQPGDPSIGGAAPNVLDLTADNSGGNAEPIRISADTSNNSVVIYGDSDRAGQILATLKKLDATPIQVAINVTIAEVRLTKQLQYGVQYFINSKHLGLGSNNGSISLVDAASNVLSSKVPGLNFVLGSNSNPDVIISALNVLSDVEVLSSPSLVVLENQTATLQVGDEVPITTRQSQSTENSLAPVVNQVEFKNTGILLNVTPRIGQNDAVTMDIEQEISNVSSGANTLTPTISKRSIKSQISIADQQTVVLGGLISGSSGDDKRDVPGLSKVPVFGGLFSNKDKTHSRSELIVLIRPVIIRDAQDAANVADSLRSQMYVIGDRSYRPLK